MSLDDLSEMLKRRCLVDGLHLQHGIIRSELVEVLDHLVYEKGYVYTTYNDSHYIAVTSADA